MFDLSEKVLGGVILAQMGRVRVTTFLENLEMSWKCQGFY